MKKKISMIVASLGLALGLGLALVTPALAEVPGAFSGGLTEGIEKAKPTDTNVPSNFFGDGGIFSDITNIMLFLVGAISVIMIIVGAIRYVTSSGDAKQVESAKNTILYAVIGLILAILAFALVNFISSIFIK